MGTITRSTCSFLIIINAIVSCTRSCNANNNVTQAMFVFGDSLYDNGNAVIYDSDSHLYNPSAHYPYGLSYFPFPTGRQSDGLLVPDFISMFADVNLVEPYLHGDVPFPYGANFAFQGATVFPRDDPSSMDLPQQLDGFYNVLSNWTSELGGDEAKEKLKKAVIFMELGGIDYVVYSSDTPNATQAEQQHFVTQVIDALVIAIKAMYDVGARKFAFQNTAPLGCSPRSRVTNGVITSGDCSQFQVSKMATMHNAALSSVAQELEAQLSDFKYGIFDFYTVQLDMINNPKHYGFYEGEIACCGSGMLNSGTCGEEPYMVCTNPSAFVFFDDAHNTHRANLIMSQMFWEGNSSHTNNATMEPYSLKQLFNSDSSTSTSSSKLMVS